MITSIWESYTFTHTQQGMYKHDEYHHKMAMDLWADAAVLTDYSIV